MVRNGGMTSRRWRSDSIDGLDLSPCEDDEVHVLAVDDSLVDRKVIEKLLKISSCKVTAVDSGIRALQFLGLDKEKSSASVGFHELKVDLIITDYCMPGMTGYDLLKKIKESSTFRETPVVIMSSENVVARIHRCLEEGAEDFIVKPVKLSDVKRLRGYMATREVRGTTEEKGNNNKNKRKAREDCESSGDLSTSASSISSSPTTLSPSFSPSPSPVLSILSSPAPCSPSSLVSPTRRLKMSGSD